jgi:hypothetical protein
VTLSHDVYSYVDYARLGVEHGLDPYVHAPRAAPADPVFAEVDWKGATSAYGPLFTLLTYPLAPLSVGAAVAALKALSAASTLVLVALVSRLAARRGVDPLRAAAFVGLNPLVLVHVVGGAHNDAAAMLVAMLGVAAVLAGAELSGGAAFAAAFAVKASAAFAAPFALLGTARPTGLKRHSEWRNRPVGGGMRIVAGAIAGLALVALAAAPAFGLHWLDALGVAGNNLGRKSHMSVPIRFAIITGADRETARVVALYICAVALAVLLLLTWRGADWVRMAGWAALVLLLTTTWLLPRYLIWVLPFAAISRDRPLVFLTLALTAFQLGTRIPL